jgi:hypothetical protein
MNIAKEIEWTASAIAFAVLTKRCGKSIDKRDWEGSVFWFLLALATILYAVKSAPVL